MTDGRQSSPELPPGPVPPWPGAATVRAVRRGSSRPSALLAVAVLGLLGGLLAGCGGGSGGGSSSQAALGEAAFRQQAAAICQDARRRLQAVPQPGSPSAIGTTLEQQVPIAEDRLDRLASLAPPSELRDTYSETISLLRQQVELARGVRDAIAGGGNPGAEVAKISKEQGRLTRELDARADALGVPQCRSDGGRGQAGSTTAASAAPAPTPTTTAPSDTFGADLSDAGNQLKVVGSTLQGVKSIKDLQGKAPRLGSALDRFDQALSRMGTYALAAPTLEAKRARLVASGPDVSAQIRRFVAAAKRGDLGNVRKQLPQLIGALQRFSQALG
jgi:hypothetical protein